MTRKPNSLKNILLIDDDPQIRDSLAIVFEGKKYILDYAENCAAAFGKIKAGCVYDLIFMDLMMPEMGGEVCLPELKKMGVFTPVIILSAIKHKAAAKDLMKKGAADYITKPWSKNEDIIKVVEATLKKYAKG